MPATTTRAKILALQQLASSPTEQYDLAVEYLSNDRNTEVLLATARVVGSLERPGSRQPLLDCYRRYQSNDGRRDPGGLIRAELIHALQPILTVNDIDLLMTATRTYEYRPTETAGQLRAIALIALHHIAPDLAGFQAARLLVDPETSRMSGEPALTAVRVLAAGGNELLLYGYVFSEVGTMPEVIAECLRNMTGLSTELIRPLVERFQTSQDQIILLGLFDLLLNHPSSLDYMTTILKFLNDTTLLEIFHFVVSELVARGDHRILEELEYMANFETSREKEEILLRALQVR